MGNCCCNFKLPDIDIVLLTIKSGNPNKRRDLILFYLFIFFDLFMLVLRGVDVIPKYRCIKFAVVYLFFFQCEKYNINLKEVWIENKIKNIQQPHFIQFNEIKRACKWLGKLKKKILIAKCFYSSGFLKKINTCRPILKIYCKNVNS